ncbi:unnamed protein product [Adineta steineri]|uniref:ADP-ribosylation factor n=1 Tax=Adineta steineri TaxID=433720 RepID=A0A814TWB6_9BILA|nr:unnamed protein product [Adineta steineri]CAF1379548.1 unnamed protein product [Adineta steineri]
MYESFNTGPSSRILMLGLDAAGKTTILYKVKLNENLETLPTIGFNVERVSPCRGVSFEVWDVGGQENIRRLWRHYYSNTDGLIFVIDSNDQERIDEAREELHGILSAPDMSSVPLVVLANKQDLPNAMKTSDIAQKLGLNTLGGKHKWFIQPACAVTGDGLLEGMLEMSNLIKKHHQNGH